MRHKWKAVKKKKGDFAMKYPWKATNGGVCSDHMTKKEAEESCKEDNERDAQEATKLYCFGAPSCTFQTALEEIIDLFNNNDLTKTQREHFTGNVLEKYGVIAD
jgi:hypothetical protein